jgi:TatA/E family protein of Tat protein translocase
MFGTLGGPEIFLILVIALIVFGPRKLPEIGKTMGKMLAEFRKASSDFKRTIEDEVEAEKVLPAVAEGPAPVAVTAGPVPQPVPVPPETPTVSRLDGERVQPPAAMETPSRLEPPAPPEDPPAAEEQGEAAAERAAEIKPA